MQSLANSSSRFRARFRLGRQVFARSALRDAGAGLAANGFFTPTRLALRDAGADEAARTPVARRRADESERGEKGQRAAADGLDRARDCVGQARAAGRPRDFRRWRPNLEPPKISRRRRRRTRRRTKAQSADNHWSAARRSKDRSSSAKGCRTRARRTTSAPGPPRARREARPTRGAEAAAPPTGSRGRCSAECRRTRKLAETRYRCRARPGPPRRRSGKTGARNAREPAPRARATTRLTPTMNKKAMAMAWPNSFTLGEIGKIPVDITENCRGPRSDGTPPWR